LIAFPNARELTVHLHEVHGEGGAKDEGKERKGRKRELFDYEAAIDLQAFSLRNRGKDAGAPRKREAPTVSLDDLEVDGAEQLRRAKRKQREAVAEPQAEPQAGQNAPDGFYDPGKELLVRLREHPGDFLGDGEYKGLGSLEEPEEEPEQPLEPKPVEEKDFGFQVASAKKNKARKMREAAAARRVADSQPPREDPQPSIDFTPDPLIPPGGASRPSQPAPSPAPSSLPLTPASAKTVAEGDFILAKKKRPRAREPAPQPATALADNPFASLSAPPAPKPVIPLSEATPTPFEATMSALLSQPEAVHGTSLIEIEQAPRKKKGRKAVPQVALEPDSEPEASQPPSQPAAPPQPAIDFSGGKTLLEMNRELYRPTSGPMGYNTSEIEVETRSRKRKGHVERWQGEAHSAVAESPVAVDTSGTRPDPRPDVVVFERGHRKGQGQNSPRLPVVESPGKEIPILLEPGDMKDTGLPPGFVRDAFGNVVREGSTAPEAAPTTVSEIVIQEHTRAKKGQRRQRRQQEASKTLATPAQAVHQPEQVSEPAKTRPEPLSSDVFFRLLRDMGGDPGNLDGPENPPGIDF